MAEEFQQKDQEKDRAANPAQRWVKPAAWLAGWCVLVGGGVYMGKSCLRAPGETLESAGYLMERAGGTIEKSGAVLAEVAAAFNRGTISTSFISYATSITTGHYLQFATLKQMEMFTRSDEATTGFGYIPLPEVVVEARAPVEYTYFINLNAPWEFVLLDEIVYVLAPPIQNNKPAVDASGIQYEVRRGSVFRRNAAVQESLKQSITTLAHLRARENVPLVREAGRRQVSEFVENWLVRSFSDGKRYPVKVFFAGEVLPMELQTRLSGRSELGVVFY